MNSNPPTRTWGLDYLWARRDRRTRLVAVAVILGVLAVVGVFRGLSATLDVVGYPGIFLISVIGSGSLVMPLPAIAGTCGLSVVLNPVIVGLISGLGEAIGEMTGYALGFGTQDMFKGRRFYRQARRWMERRGTLALFVVSTIPNPIFDIVGVAAGATRFPAKRFFFTVWAGKTIKGLGVAYACHEGLYLLPFITG